MFTVFFYRIDGRQIKAAVGKIERNKDFLSLNSKTIIQSNKGKMIEKEYLETKMENNFPFLKLKL